MLNTYNFGRSNSFSALDNITFYDGGNINFQSADQTASWQINNIIIHNMSYVSHSNSDFRERCDGGSWNGKVRITDTNSAYLSNVGYYSSGQSTNYCHNYESSVSNWTFERMNSVSINYGSNYYSVSASYPMFFQGNFTEINSMSIQGYYYGSQHQVLRDSTFTEARISVSPSQYSYGKMNLTNNTFVDSQIILQSQSQSSTTDLILEGSSFSSTKAPTTGGSWTDYYIDGNSYGKWIIQNNTFAPANGWKNLRYTYSIAPMVAKYNYWGSNNRTIIDTNINDINDNNGGNRVDYCPFWANQAMNNLSWNCTRTRVDFTYPVNGSSQVGYNLTINYTHLMVAVGDWYLDNNSLETFNTSNNSITLTGLTMGWHQLCAQVSGLGNQQGNYCIYFQMTPYFP
ncbi:MAG: hypothetical protein QF535_15325, partial [Anaerolineales bacterium]|nr:hypothetical protein [Anaerolineales bacterium]